MAVPKDQIVATGRRKAASAGVRLVPGTGQIQVNGRDFSDYFVSRTVRGYVMQPLMVSGTAEGYNVSATIKGGGVIGQAGALRHGIARALVKIDPEFRVVLKESGMLTRDDRVKERKKYGQPGARKRFQFSKR